MWKSFKQEISLNISLAGHEIQSARNSVWGTEQICAVVKVILVAGDEDFGGDNYQGSNPGWRLEWFDRPEPSEDRPGPRLWPLLSWKELSGRGEGTVQQTQRPFIIRHKLFPRATSCYVIYRCPTEKTDHFWAALLCMRWPGSDVGDWNDQREDAVFNIYGVFLCTNREIMLWVYKDSQLWRCGRIISLGIDIGGLFTRFSV